MNNYSVIFFQGCFRAVILANRPYLVGQCTILDSDLTMEQAQAEVRRRSEFSLRIQACIGKF